MLLNSGLKLEAFIDAINQTIGGCFAVNVKEEDVEIYFGMGYWRGRPIRDEAGKLIGVELNNPDRTWKECRKVEEGIAILRHLEYKEK